MNIVIATIKSWNIKNAEKLKSRIDADVSIITEKERLTKDNLESINPDYVFFPHWSNIIPRDIYENFNCVVFHMTDLPYGRGGSPLQNLIVRGIEKTKISAIKVVKDIDAGPIYFKEELGLEGSATEILERGSDIIFEKMIPEIVEKQLKPVEQFGEPVVFKRRKPEDGEIKDDFSKRQIYDYIRMLDAEGYPRAFIDFGRYNLEFDNATYDGDELVCRVKFKQK